MSYDNIFITEDLIKKLKPHLLNRLRKANVGRIKFRYLFSVEDTLITRGKRKLCMDFHNNVVRAWKILQDSCKII